MSRFSEYLKDTKGELKHVTWPSKKTAILFTAIVIVFSVIVSIFLGAFDLLFTEILKLFI
jgi:preprotein translocase subunit SecE